MTMSEDVNGDGSDRGPGGALNAILDIHRLRQYFNVVVGARDILTAGGKDVRFLRALRRGLLPLPLDRPPAPGQVFDPPARPAPPALKGRVAVVASGGSGAMASLVGVAKALEDSGTDVSVYSACSGSAMFGFLLGAGLSPDEVAGLTASMRPAEYVDVGWRELGSLLPRLGRGWDGILRGDKLQAFFRAHLGDLTLRQLRTPTYAPVWNVEHNRLAFIGPRTYPDMPVALAIRMAISMPLLLQPVMLDGQSWCDGGIVDILPVQPVLDIEPAPDVAIAVNGFYPPGFRGEDATGWQDNLFSIVAAASQVRTCQHAELAREHLARLRGAVRTLLIEPVPYGKVAGTGFYEQFLDNREWPEFMRAGRAATLTALRSAAPRVRKSRSEQAA
jgi:NTE family protein